MYKCVDKYKKRYTITDHAPVITQWSPGVLQKFERSKKIFYCILNYEMFPLNADFVLWQFFCPVQCAVKWKRFVIPALDIFIKSFVIPAQTFLWKLVKRKMKQKAKKKNPNMWKHFYHAGHEYFLADKSNLLVENQYWVTAKDRRRGKTIYIVEDKSNNHDYYITSG